MPRTNKRIEPQNIHEVDLEKLALDKERFGPLVFDEIFPTLQRIKEIFIEFATLNFRKNLPSEHRDLVERMVHEFSTYLEQIRVNDLKSNPNFSSFKQDMDQTIDRFYAEVLNRLMNPLNLLRNFVAPKSTDKEELEKLQKDALKAKSAYETTEAQLQGRLGELQAKLVELEQKKETVAAEHGAVASTEMAAHFATQAKNDEDKAQEWLKKRNAYFRALLFWIFGNFAGFLFLHLGILGITADEFFNQHYAIFNIAVISALSVAVAFCSKNFKVYSNLAVTNDHRRNVGQTLRDVLSAVPEPDIRAQLLNQGADALFKHIHSGFVKDDQDKGGSTIALTPTIKMPGA